MRSTRRVVLAILPIVIVVVLGGCGGFTKVPNAAWYTQLNTACQQASAQPAVAGDAPSDQPLRHIIWLADNQFASSWPEGRSINDYAGAVRRYRIAAIKYFGLPATDPNRAGARKAAVEIAAELENRSRNAAQEIPACTRLMSAVRS